MSTSLTTFLQTFQTVFFWPQLRVFAFLCPPFFERRVVRETSGRFSSTSVNIDTRTQDAAHLILYMCLLHSILSWRLSSDLMVGVKSASDRIPWVAFGKSSRPFWTSTVQVGPIPSNATTTCVCSSRVFSADRMQHVHMRRQIQQTRRV